MILCIGEAVIDMFQENGVFVPLPGGCAYNTSLAIGKLGIPVSFLGRISKSFFGEIQIKRLREYNVRDNLLIRCDQNTILAFIKTEEGKQPQYAFYDEGTADKLLSPDDLPVLPPDVSCIVFGSISMAMEPIATTIENFIFKEAQNKVITFDPNIRPFIIKDKNAYLKRFKKWTGASTILKISLEDFEYIDNDPEPQNALLKLAAMGARLSIITLGPEGAMALLKRDNGGVISARAEGIRVPDLADTVGAGDTFLGAFLSWLETKGKMSHNVIAGLSETELNEALAFANSAAAIVCSRRGAQPPSPEEINFRNIM
ncbi:MAG: carbohydrate kinase [Treponema sp.]|nr:carbohydrate kinase [Treponema sp.]MCL2271513.1 carbohydrate kinase [Treponema sp.]